MANLTKARERGIGRRFETDARSIVPIQDEIGGTAIYFNGRLAYYVLNGEWIQAVPGPVGGTVGEGAIHDRLTRARATRESGEYRLTEELSRIL